MKASEQVRKLLGQALRLIDRNELFEGFEQTPQTQGEPTAPSPVQQLEIEPPDRGAQSEEPQSEHDERRRLPHSPGSAAAAGDVRRRGVGRIELRALGDHSVRSGKACR